MALEKRHEVKEEKNYVMKNVEGDETDADQRMKNVKVELMLRIMYKE